MKKQYLITVISLFLFVTLSSGSFAMDYQHTLDTKDMQFSWTIEADQIHVQLSAKTTGWVAIGFDPESVMEGANIIIGVAKDDKAKIEDHYGNRKRGHENDTELGGTSDVLNPSGSEKDGVTTIAFTLPLKTEDKFDKEIKTEGMYRIMLAHGAGKDSFKSRHPYRAVYDVNFSTGENKKIK
ncbi:MAG: DOMON domain-containing protein [Proteobacteria bacterium]|nr:DOMON domain-containing protein [Pseudomonadota bacterium]MBU1389938.1 DOMON domain-containing protein [Pseudomonadota bacterium]MBU1542537.1 DOMON domain-containing protein [Pseudomonadota bacterium]MBU2429565.1 DOMON domain-containing protein [Pseudomonadota bacterium]MBU2479706.1 DOMON domain-containing protein [Pseudomonadota bacterium]